MIPSDWLQSPIEDLDSLETTFQPGSSRPLAEWEEWRRFRAQMEPGDVVMPFSSGPESWAQLSGRAGYALVREEQVVAVLITRVN